MPAAALRAFLEILDDLAERREPAAALRAFLEILDDLAEGREVVIAPRTCRPRGIRYLPDRVSRSYRCHCRPGTGPASRRCQAPTGSRRCSCVMAVHGGARPARSAAAEPRQTRSDLRFPLLVSARGLEPPWISPHGPQPCASTYSATPTWMGECSRGSLLGAERGRSRWCSGGRGCRRPRGGPPEVESSCSFSTEMEPLRRRRRWCRGGPRGRYADDPPVVDDVVRQALGGVRCGRCSGCAPAGADPAFRSLVQAGVLVPPVLALLG